MAFTAADIDKLKAAIATGALRVEFRDQVTVFRSLAEMKETLAMMIAEVYPDQTLVRRTVAGYRSGY